LDAPVNAFFASFPLGVVKTGNVGRIHEKVDFWVEHFCPDAYVLGILVHGYKVPVNWEQFPEAYEEADNKSAQENYDFVQEEVARLLESSQIVKCDEKPRCCNPLTVAVKRKDNGELKNCLVLDLSRCVSLAVKDDGYYMTTFQDAINSTRKGDFQVVFDLKSAFHHIRLHTSIYELMGFMVTYKEGAVTYYCYVVLVFGFKVAPQVLGRVLKPVISFLIQNRIPVVWYLDNGLLVGPSKARVIRRYKFALDVFDKAGLLISFEKSSIPEDASTGVKFLGVFGYQH
jgi:hypothetical protein